MATGFKTLKKQFFDHVFWVLKTLSILHLIVVECITSINSGFVSSTKKNLKKFSKNGSIIQIIICLFRSCFENHSLQFVL